MGIRKVSAEEFKTAFNDAREWLLNGMFVGYHSDFSNCECYLTPADLGGFAITPQRELVNAFNCEGGISLLGDEEVKKIILSKVDWFVVLGYYEKNSHQPMSICDYYERMLGFKKVCFTRSDLSDMIADKGLSYALSFVDSYGIPFHNFMINSRFDLKNWNGQRELYDNSYVVGKDQVLSFIKSEDAKRKFDIEDILGKLKDHWVNMSNDEIRAEVNKIYPGALYDVQYI